jgi:N-acetylmuramoyl-L-alanine amidase
MERDTADNTVDTPEAPQATPTTPNQRKGAGSTVPKANKEKLEEKREERAKSESIADGLKFVIDGAKILCPLCIVPIGTLKVNYNTPTIQNKKTATIEEKSSASLQFSGNCLKSPKSALPCKAVMKLGQWANTGSGKVQDRSPLLRRSTIPCNYGGSTITITDDGQRQEAGSAPGAPVPEVKEATIIDAYFGIENGNSYKRLTWAGVEDAIYIIVKTIGLADKKITVNIIDRDGILYTGKNTAIEVLQDDTTKTVRLTTTVYPDGTAVIPITLKPSTDDKDTKTWRDKIAKTKDKKAYLSLLVDAHTPNPDFEITYNGRNPEGENAEGTGAKLNYFLDMKDKWFELKRKDPVIVIDPGHGYTKGNTGAVSFIYTHKIKGTDGKPELDNKKLPKTAKNNVETLPQYVIDDPVTWVVSTKEDPDRSERFLVHDVGAKLKTLLEAKEYKKIFITRARGPIAGSDDSATRQARIDISNNNKADYFISVHADGVDNMTATGSHVIYSGSADTKSEELATDIFSTYTIVAVEATSPKTDVRGLQILKGVNKAERKVLIELGFVTTPKDAKSLFTSIDTIASQVKDGLIVNINKNF